MAIPRRLLVDPEITSLYHCISRCVRRALLCGPGYEHRKVWIEARLQELAAIFAIDVCGYSVLDNHLHTVLRLDPIRTKHWSDREVAERWVRLYPLRDRKGQVLPVSESWLADRAADVAWVETRRKRLSSLSWFMKCLKEPLAKQANREDEATGAFWAERFKSVAILDDESLLAICAYVDLNPVAAGICSTPEESSYTSIHARVEHCREQGGIDELTAESPDPSRADRIAAMEQSHWLCPIDDRRRQGAQRAGLLEGLTLRSYLLLVDWTSRLYREGKARVSSEAAAILDRLGTSVESWEGRLRRLLGRSKLVGTALGSVDSLKRLAAQRGQQWVNSVAGRDALRPQPAT